MKHILTLLKANKKYIAYLITIAILYLSLAKLPSTTVKISNADKIYHSIAYFALTLSWLYAFASKKNSVLWISISCIVFGIIIELLQALITNYRSGDFFDVLANTLGTFAAIIAFVLIFQKK